LLDQNDAVIPLNELTVAKAKEYCRYRERKKSKDFWYTTCNEPNQINSKGEVTMKRSTDRILTTHCGSLARPKDLLDLMKAKINAEP
jgi:hypothetical protein